MTGIEALIIPALIPVVSDAVKGIINKLTGQSGATPKSVDEEMKLMQAKAEWMKALAELDKPTGETSRWVNDLRASFRYLAAAAIIIVAFATLFIPTLDAGYVEMAWTSAQAAFAFIFGDRMYVYLRRR
ncbi:MAG: hypothetical protein HY886_08340 [Deltaproteobacteria bacterium]|nr:hypothetical protein [Deltaproteobacteria bacterium]